MSPLCRSRPPLSFHRWGIPHINTVTYEETPVLLSKRCCRGSPMSAGSSAVTSRPACSLILFCLWSILCWVNIWKDLCFSIYKSTSLFIIYLSSLNNIQKLFQRRSFSCTDVQQSLRDSEGRAQTRIKQGNTVKVCNKGAVFRSWG